MNRIIKELEEKRRHELFQIGLTHRTNFNGTQEEHDNYHRERANEYAVAIKILSSKLQTRHWLDGLTKEFDNYEDAKKDYDDYIESTKNGDSDIQLLIIVDEFNNVD